MENNSLVNINGLFWLIDCKQKVEPVVLKKVIKLAQAYKGKLTIIFDTRYRSAERSYWFLEKELKNISEEWIKSVAMQKGFVIDRLTSSNVPFEQVEIDSGNYNEVLNRLDDSSLLIIQDVSSALRHPIYQEFTRLPGHICVLSNRKWQEKALIIGAIDPLHENSRPFDLDHKIVEHTSMLADAVSAQWHLVHSTFLQPQFLQYKKQINDIHQEGVYRFLGEVNVAKKKVNLLHGLPEQAIARHIQQNKVDLCIMGIVARNKWLAHLIGSTTIALLQEPPCDMLFLKSHSDDRES